MKGGERWGGYTLFGVGGRTEEMYANEKKPAGRRGDAWLKSEVSRTG